MTKNAKFFLFSQLATADEKPFDCMAAGDFVDMYGRATVIKREDLATFVVNTQRNIAATRAEGGEVVGLPIDWMNHNHGEAAGWIVDVALAGDGRDVILCTPRWNEMGRELIGKDTVRYFSPEFDPRAKCIVGGSLTNWPATRTREQKILLRPIALSQLSAIQVDESLDERVGKIRGAFRDFTNSWYVYAVEVFDGYLIARDEDEGKLYKVGFQEVEGGLTFDDRTVWVEVKQTYIEAAMSLFRDIFNRVFSGLSKNQDQPAAPEVEEDPAEDPGSNSTTEVSMTDVSQLSKEERQALLSQLTSGSELPAELATLIDQRANERVSALLAVEQRKRDTAVLASRLVGGTAEAPRGLPVDKTELADFLLSLSPEQAEKATALLGKIQANGLVDFAERGHSREVSGTHELPAEYAAKLDNGELSLADLSNPVLALGDLSQYNLSRWKEK